MKSVNEFRCEGDIRFEWVKSQLSSNYHFSNYRSLFVCRTYRMRLLYHLHPHAHLSCLTQIISDFRTYAVNSEKLHLDCGYTEVILLASITWYRVHNIVLTHPVGRYASFLSIFFFFFLKKSPYIIVFTMHRLHRLYIYH